MTFQPELVYEKTEEGRLEVAARSFGITQTQRSALVLIDGKKPGTQLLSMLGSAVGLTADDLNILLQHGLIRPIPRSAQQSMAVAPAAVAPAQAAPEPAPAPSVTADDAQRFREGYRVLAAATSSLGFRGVLIAQAVERASNLQELMEVRTRVYEALVKSKGQAAADIAIGQFDAAAK